MSDKHDKTPLVIIGGGAAGLMGASLAGELGIPTLLIERKHRLGSKLLMCGNGRCNLTSRLEPQQMLTDFGEPLGSFLQPALQAFSPAMLMRWFEQRGLPLMQTSDGKVFPRSERAPDVVRCFQDTLRRGGVSICMQSPVERIEPLPNGGFKVQTDVFSLQARFVLLATGGVSYPKTGSVGDGQRMAGALGLRVLPFRPGLVGVEWTDPWMQQNHGKQFNRASVSVYDDSCLLGETHGLLEVERWGLGGGCISNATRLLSRASAKCPTLEIRPAPQAPVIRIRNVTMRPLKEAMVTVGGVDLAEISNTTFEASRVPGLFLAGEVLDIDGPTGGYNLTAAFATARLAVQEVARRGNFKKTEDRGRRSEVRGRRSEVRGQKSDVGAGGQGLERKFGGSRPAGGWQKAKRKPRTGEKQQERTPNAQRSTPNQEQRPHASPKATQGTAKNVRRRPR